MPKQNTIHQVRLQRRILAVVLSLLLLLVALCLSLLLGSRSIAWTDTWDALLTGPQAGDAVSTIIWEQRLPRTLVAVVCGVALAVAGSLMQSLTRNPLAEPGLLGVNAGASVAVVLSVVLLGVQSLGMYVVAALVGAIITTLAVYLLGQKHNGSMAKLALAGVAIAAALSALNQALILSNSDAYNEFRFWAAGSIEGRTMSVFWGTAPIIALALVLALALLPTLHTMSLGEEAATSLGVNVARASVLCLTAVVLLAATATAAIGPITFVGLAVPFIVRYLVGNDVRWVTVGSAILGPAWLLLADVLARVIIAPEETQVGIIATLVGAPLFVALMSRRKVEAL